MSLLVACCIRPPNAIYSRKTEYSYYLDSGFTNLSRINIFLWFPEQLKLTDTICVLRGQKSNAVFTRGPKNNNTFVELYAHQMAQLHIQMIWFKRSSNPSLI